MFRKIAAVSFFAITVAGLSGCDQKVTSNTVTHYSTDLCALDVIAGKPDSTVYVKAGVVNFSGWLVDSSKGTVAKELRLRLTGLQGVPHTFKDPIRVDRPDIVKAYKDEKLLKSGFSFDADLSSLSAGGYGIILEIPDGKSLIVCQPKKVLVVQ